MQIVKRWLQRCPQSLQCYFLPFKSAQRKVYKRIIIEFWIYANLRYNFFFPPAPLFAVISSYGGTFLFHVLKKKGKKGKRLRYAFSLQIIYVNLLLKTNWMPVIAFFYCRKRHWWLILELCTQLPSKDKFCRNGVGLQNIPV